MVAVGHSEAGHLAREGSSRRALGPAGRRSERGVGGLPPDFEQSSDVPGGEVEAGELVHVGTHQHVGVGERVGRLQEEESDQPVRHEERGVGVELRRQVVGRVGHDHLRGSRGPRDGHRQVGGEPSVDEIATVAQLGVEQQRHGDAGANRLGQVAGGHDHRRPIRQIGGDGAERNGKRVEIPTGEQIAAEQGGVHQRVDLRLDDRGALQIEARSPCSHRTSGCSTPRRRGARG